MYYTGTLKELIYHINVELALAPNEIVNLGHGRRPLSKNKNRRAEALKEGVDHWETEGSGIEEAFISA